ncbi:MAG: DNA-processing protein DprA, partial [Oscillospiraceae bacterium]
EAAQSLTASLAKAGVVIVSGLAVGIDTICHTAALKAGGKTIAVLGCGIDYNYPTSNAELKRIISENGAVITEYPPGTPPIARNFPFRNRIISGISLGVVVVEANEKSGSLITAGHALSQGRDVFAVPNSIFESGAKGTHKLIKQGAKIVTSPIDILEEYFHLYAEKMNDYGINLEDSTATLFEKTVNDIPKSVIKKIDMENSCEAVEKPIIKKVAKSIKTPPSYLTKLQLEIYNLLDTQPVSIQIIYTTLNLTISETLSTLTELEIYDLVKAMPGRKFSLK